MHGRIPLIYALSSGRLYGMQQMAYATVSGLSDEFEPIIFVPPGPAACEARARGFDVVETSSLASGEVGGIFSEQAWSFAAQLRPYFAKHERLAFLGTRCMHNIVFAAMNVRYRRSAANIHVVHGTEDDPAYGQKRVLDRVPFPMTILAVSDYPKQRMQAHGLRRPIRVIENYLTDEHIGAVPRRGPFWEQGVRRAAVVARLDPFKRIDVLLTCLEAWPNLNSITFHIYGDGPEGDALRLRAKRSGLNVLFEGFRSDVAQELPKADLLVHLGPQEALPLALLEAMAANVPIVAPNRGGAACVVEHGVSGLLFEANDGDSLGACLTRMLGVEAGYLNELVAGGRARLSSRFSETERLADYRSLISECLGSYSRPEARTNRLTVRSER